MEKSGQQTRNGATVDPQSTSFSWQVPFKRRANPEFETAIATVNLEMRGWGRATGASACHTVAVVSGIEAGETDGFPDA